MTDNRPVVTASIMAPNYWGAAVLLSQDVDASVDALKFIKNLAMSYLLAEHPHGLDGFDTSLRDFATKNVGKRVKLVVSLSSTDECGELRCSVCQGWLEPGGPIYGRDKDHLVCWRCRERTPSDSKVR